jgi:cytochrome c-type biogenesis protein CcsB
MQKKLTDLLFSTRLTGILFILFAVAMITGTFLDASQETSPTPLTRTLIYHAVWFKAIMLLFAINFIGNIFKYRLLRKEKWPVLLFHLSFILIIIGAGITHYISFEGMMSIREGETQNKFVSTKTYVTTYIDGDYMVDGQAQRRILENEVDFSPRLNNNFKVKADYNGQPFTVELEKFIKDAEERVVPDESGDEYFKIVEAGQGGRHDHYLRSGEIQSIHNVLFALNKPTKGAINITTENGELFIESPFEGEYMQMLTQTTSPLIKDSIQPFNLRSLYTIGTMRFVAPEPVFKGKFDMVAKENPGKNEQDGILLKVTANNESKYVSVLGGQGYTNAFKQVKLGDLTFAFRYGPKVLELPFSIKLNDFVAERYPGTERSFSAFSSQVTVIDKEKGDFDYKIFMNNILDHRGYRFFQSSFDSDEKGTILSVNHDFWGTWVTYIGYFLLFFGMLVIMFVKGTRFADLGNQLNKLKKKKAKLLTVLFICIGLAGFGQDHSENDGHNHGLKPTKVQIDSILKANITPVEHAEAFGKLVIQDIGGRMMPVNTYASELLRKLSKYDTYEDLTADQVYLSINESPLLWYNVPVIYLRLKKGDSIRNIIGVDKSQKYVTLADFFDDKGEYKLGKYLEDAYKAQTPNAYEKEFKETDQRINLLYNTIEGRSLRIFPLPDDYNNKWISSYEYKTGKYKIQDTLYANFINSGLSAYLYSLNTAKRSPNPDFSEANKLLQSFKKTQEKYGQAVMLSDDKINTEIAYNKYDIFKKLFSWYMYAGTLMFLILIIQIFKSNSRFIDLTVKILKYSIVVLFLLHTAGLIVRWYISGHAPWSDAYESMIYVAWATMLFGLIFGRKSDLTIAATAFVTSMILMIAHWNWMDPAIANLQPVLNSYWLMIHVAVIVASYGPFTLGMILGLVCLILMVFTNKKNRNKMLLNIKELTIINEMALTVGLVLLTIGNFLGGMWANESWGRYWGWDPKETWALISIFVYAFVLHMRLIPGLRGRFAFNLASMIAFGSIMFTYFGVNFYLSGLHSYQSGQQIASFQIIAVAVVLTSVLGILAYRKYLKYLKK